MPRYAAKTDANHAEVRDALRELGWHVEDTSRVGGGFPDLVAIKGSRIEFCEVKDGAKSASRQKLTDAQGKLHAALARAGVIVKTLKNLDDCERL